MSGNRLESAGVITAAAVFGLAPAWLPRQALADVCFIMSLAVKFIGLPDQIRVIVREKAVTGLSLLNNVLNYESYVLWALLGRVTRDAVLTWGMLPGVLSTAVIVWLNVRYGTFPWHRKRGVPPPIA